MNINDLASLYTTNPEFVRQAMTWRLLTTYTWIGGWTIIALILAFLTPGILQFIMELSDAETASTQRICGMLALIFFIIVLCSFLPSLIQIYVYPEVALWSVIRGF